MTIINGTAGDDVLNGKAGDDTLSGLDGNDNLFGGAGNDRLDGGNGFDVVSYSAASAGISLNLSTGTATGGDGSDTLIGIEGAYGSGFADTLIGDAAANNLLGNAGDDSISGAAGIDYLVGNTGNDTLDGGADNDYATYFLAGGPVTVNLTLGTATGADGNDVLISIENAGGSNGFGDTLIGNAAANLLSGEGGDDVLEGLDGGDNLSGGAGNDRLDGGSGYDYASYGAASAGISLNLSTGTATGGDGSDTLIGIEGAYGSGFADTLIGDAAANNLLGNAGDDSISGAAGIDYLVGNTGNDTLDGGADNDYATYFLAGGPVAVNLTLGTATGADGNDVLISIENAGGSNSYGDTLIGNAAVNLLSGEGGDDVIDGNGGQDTVTGGGGRDLFRLSPLTGALLTITDFSAAVSGDALDLSLLLAYSAASGGYDVYTDPFAKSYLRVQQIGSDAVVQWDPDGQIEPDPYSNSEPRTWQTVAVLQNVNVATLVRQNYSGIAIVGTDRDDTLVGDIWTDLIVAGLGNDTLDGGAGADRMEGGRGADTYYVDNATDLVVEADNALGIAPDPRPGLDLGGSIDKVIASVSFSLGAYVENLTLAAAAGNLSGTGNALDNVLLGNEGHNSFTGAGGNDNIDGGAGADTAVYSGKRAEFTVSKTSTGLSVVDSRGSDGTDTLTNIERLQFADARVAIDTGAAQSAGGTALLIGAVLGQGALAAKKPLVGAVLDLIDQGYSFQTLSGAVMRLDIWGLLANGGATSASNTQIASYLLTTVNGTTPDATTLNAAVTALDSETGAAQGTFLWHLAESAANQQQVNLVGLAQSGLEFEA